MIATTAALSQLTNTVFPTHCFPHIAAAISIHNHMDSSAIIPKLYENPCDYILIIYLPCFTPVERCTKQVQCCDVQSDLDKRRRSSSSDGIVDGSGRACGSCAEKSKALFLDRASANMLSTPFMWAATKLKLNWAAMNERQCMRCIHS